jgi:hypothetical protein
VPPELPRYNRSLVDHLERLLLSARRGELEGLAAVACFRSSAGSKPTYVRGLLVGEFDAEATLGGLARVGLLLVRRCTQADDGSRFWL